MCATGGSVEKELEKLSLCPNPKLTCLSQKPEGHKERTETPAVSAQPSLLVGRGNHPDLTD